MIAAMLAVYVVWRAKRGNFGAGEPFNFKRFMYAAGRSPWALGGPVIAVEKGKDERAALFAWMRSPDNPFFARSFVNRVWAHYFGVGIVDPVDDFSQANPPSNARLLDALAEAREMMEHLVEPPATDRGGSIRGGREPELEVLPHGEPGEDPEVLGDEAHAEPGDLVRRAPGQNDALELDLAAPGLEKADGGLQERRLAHPVAAEQRDRLAGAHLQRNA